jgi:hypothetical protein
VKRESSLHLSQKVFWFCASACLVIGTIVFCIQVVRGRETAVKFLGVEITSAKAEASIITARERLLTIRTKLDDAAEINDTATIDRILPEFDDVLKALGVAEAAVKRRGRWGDDAAWNYNGWSGSDYGTYYYPDDRMHDKRNDSGGLASPSPPKELPSATPKPNR